MSSFSSMMHDVFAQGTCAGFACSNFSFVNMIIILGVSILLALILISILLLALENEREYHRIMAHRALFKPTA